MTKHDLTYYFNDNAQSVKVDGVSDEDVEKVRSALENPNGIINISHRETYLYFIPVRNIMLVKVDEQEASND